ncbi:PVC-type heme-binding CxxCH protein [Schlesneria sp. DSM 10557]|uniref:PVC-type heme-binding CxxCH protein n=1 Tax=Schlesneria sp. DSM 10557 TaxID=3044399 RepID=UPI0035A0242D
MLSRALNFFALHVAICSCALAQDPVWQSKVINTLTPGHAVEVDVDVAGAKELFLVVRDGGDTFTADWADWAEPRLILDSGDKRLTELKWKSASADWGQVRINQNADGGPLRIDGKVVEYGIGVHANSVVAFDLPAGVKRFKARAGIDNGGSDQGASSSVQFLVFTTKPGAKYLQPSGGTPGGSRDPQDAVSGLDVAEGLEATLFASEASGLLSPTNIDIDHLGRVWVCEVVNYRGRLGERAEGDRILILEDLNSDGVADKQHVFYQGREVDSAMGICVLPTATGKGTKVIISCAPHVWIFTDDDGNLRADRKELLFSKVGDPQHDHSTHTFVMGPDGKLYWNMGNTGRHVFDKDGKPVIDVMGREVNERGMPYRQGMAFRCNLDGSEFEVLGYNFRNNYEVTVDSFGTVWQSDNDDDGNQGVRINYVMEGGNFGYTDEMTGAGWQTPRTNIEAEIPRRHWHLNDPGVVPNLVQTGGGSPTGICVYEGTLLPKLYQNQIIHCDAGPNVVRAYPVKNSGAGYSGEMVSILHGARDNWFRPSDVCVAPDGSLIVADWYDPGVGGHRMGDAEKGRLFRVAPPKTAYQIPKLDVSTPDGAADGLKSPNLAARYLARTALLSFANRDAGKTVGILFNRFERDSDPRYRARVLAILSQIPAAREKAISTAISDPNPDLRIAGLRLARQKLPPTDSDKHTQGLVKILATLVGDSSPQVRRECALALRLLKSPVKAELWGKLAVQHDGTDRWYLEALGIGADQDWDNCLAAAAKAAGNPSSEKIVTSPVARDILWRSRGTATPEDLYQILASDDVTEADAPRYLRAFDFLTGPAREAALIKLAFGQFGSPAKTQYVNAEAISRLQRFDLAPNSPELAAMNRVLDGMKGQPSFVQLVGKFNVTNRFPDLLALTQSMPDEQTGVDAVRVLVDKNQKDLLNAALRSTEGTSAVAVATALSHCGSAQVAEILLPLVADQSFALDLRREAIKGASRSRQGAAELIKLAESNTCDESLIPALAAALHSSTFDDVRKSAERLFPLPPGKDSKPLPPLEQLAQMKGNSGSGQKLFASTAKCNTCHVVHGQGKEVGPNLSEIGSKLSRQALYESILFPSAGISHNYESWTFALEDGTSQTGIIVSEDGEKVTLKGSDAIVRTFPVKAIEERSKQTVSLMPADFAKLISQEELVDIVEYLTTLRKPR